MPLFSDLQGLAWGHPRYIFMRAATSHFALERWQGMAWDPHGLRPASGTDLQADAL